MSSKRHKQQANKRHAHVFAALGDQTRLSLVSKLSDGQPRSITQLADDHKLSRQAITKHLHVLENAGIVQSSRSGRESIFQFDVQPLDELQNYLRSVSDQWDQTLARLKSFVEEQ
ncbi:MAG: winged helix-turn-helix transcriptional regulator [Cyanobacteria bacterium SZAS-4]|nr:winged helix-turn-helix transcriptional regulator [Cyanobacteria bacterium SZAS-4]